MSEHIPTSRLPDANWLKAYAAALNASPVYRSAAAGWSYGPVGIVVTDAGERSRRFAGILDLASGTCRAAYVASESKARACATVLEGTAADWQRVASGDLDATQALFDRVIEVQGRLGGLMRYLRGAQALLQSVTLIGTDVAIGCAELGDRRLQVAT